MMTTVVRQPESAAPAKPPGLTRRIGQELSAWTEHIVGSVPGSTGVRLRTAYYRRKLRHLGANPIIETGMQIAAAERISIGDHFYALRNCFFAAPYGGTIELGDYVSLAANVVLNAGDHGVIRVGNRSGIANNCLLRTSQHRYDDPTRPFKTQGHRSGTIIIEQDVWVTANCVLLPGTYLERGCIVCPGSVVSGRIKAFTIVAGNPPRVIGRRGEPGASDVAQGSPDLCAVSST